MSYLLRVELPDVPGSLGRLASTIGAAGGNIDAIEIIERSTAGDYAVDDVFLNADGVMPDSIVSACNQLDGVRVLWIQRYAAGTNLFLDLEVVETMTEEPHAALERLIEALPQTFRVDWGVHVRREGDGITVVLGTPAAPTSIPGGITWPGDLEKGERIVVPDKWEGLILAGTALGPDDAIVVGRRGGPEFLDSEIARLAHLSALADSIKRAG